jgi:hypothetical protein
MNAISSSFYAAVTAWISRSLLYTPAVRGIYIRRSVAAREAVFPWSDVDLAIVLESSRAQDLVSLARRYEMARRLFPRLGECLVFTPQDLLDFAGTDPYRASLDRRVHLTVAGEPPVIPARDIPPGEAARRLVFWFDEYVPLALHQGNRRNLRKFALEMANALGVIEGRWPQPLPSRSETIRRCGPLPGDPFDYCCTAAAKAHARLLAPAPPLQSPIEMPGLLVVTAPRPAFRPSRLTRVLTPEALDLLLQTSNPSLWWSYGEKLASAGFAPPSPAAWRAYALRCLAAHRLRAPVFSEAGTAGVFNRVRAAARILQEPPPPLPNPAPSPEHYYAEVFEPLSEWAARHRSRLLARA